MLLDDKTIKEFGYSQTSLSKHSKNMLWLKCDYCSNEYTNAHCRRVKSNAMLDKDACRSCRMIKIGDINFAKLGVRNVFELKSTKDKLTKTNLDRYGVERPSQSQAIKDKVKDTMMERYGVDKIMDIDGVRDKIKETNLKKYGVENASSVEEFKEKRKNTCKERFGKETYLGSEDCIKKTKEVTGVDNVFQLESVKEKSRQTMLEKYGVDNLMKLPEVRKDRVKKCRQTKIDKGILAIHKGRTKKEWAEETGFSRSRFSVLVKENGWELAVKMTPRISSLEAIVEDWLKQAGIEYSKQVKIGRYYADFTIGNLAIELNGTYWHSELHKKDDYHVKKREFYIEQGFVPLFFGEDEVTQKFHIIKSIILNKLGKSTRLFARKLKIGQVGKKEGAKFLEDNHLMGQGRGECIGLYDGTELVSLMRLRRVKGNDWEISRFCNKVGHSIVGGLSKILSFFTEVFKPEGLISFVDLRYGTGDYMEGLGFVRGKAFKSFKWTDGKNLFNRMKFPSNTGYDHKLYKLWDCGQLKFSKKFK
jgi:very-short-patch-repair endonuclease